MGFVLVCTGLCYLGMTLDFFTILLTGNSFLYFIGDNKYLWSCILSLMWLAPAYILGLYVGIALLMPKRKWYIMPVYLVLGVIYEVYLFLDFEGSIILEYPANPGENIIEATLVAGSPVFIVIVIFTLSLMLIGLGLLIKSIQSTGVLRKKYLLIALGLFIVNINGILDVQIPAGIVSIPIRIGTISGFWLFYLALREEPEKVKKVRAKKEVKVEESLFRISKRPDHITEEEISISKERKICLVCKGKAIGLTYICTECEAFYCMNCAQAISNLENACWVCNAPIDPSKPVRPFIKEEEAIEVEISESPKITPKKPPKRPT